VRMQSNIKFRSILKLQMLSNLF